jgi:hypothetical protein
MQPRQLAQQQQRAAAAAAAPSHSSKSTQFATDATLAWLMSASSAAAAAADDDDDDDRLGDFMIDPSQVAPTKVAPAVVASSEVAPPEVNLPEVDLPVGALWKPPKVSLHASFLACQRAGWLKENKQLGLKKSSKAWNALRDGDVVTCIETTLEQGDSKVRLAYCELPQVPAIVAAANAGRPLAVASLFSTTFGDDFDAEHAELILESATGGAAVAAAAGLDVQPTDRAAFAVQVTYQEQPEAQVTACAHMLVIAVVIAQLHAGNLQPNWEAMHARHVVTEADKIERDNNTVKCTALDLL